MVLKDFNIALPGPGICFLCCFFLFLSCKKEPEKISGEILIGDHTSMIADNTERTIEGSYNNYEDLFLDLDNDDSSDVRLVVAMYGSPGMGVHYFSELQVLNDRTGIAGFFNLDTTYLERKIRIFEDDYNVYKSIAENYSCRLKNLSDEIVETGTDFYPTELELNDILSVSGTFARDSVSFIYNSVSPAYTYVENDTVIVESGSWEWDCHRLPYGEEVYLGYRINGDRERLGWIKLILTSEAMITVTEVAIER